MDGQPEKTELDYGNGMVGTTEREYVNGRLYKESKILTMNGAEIVSATMQYLYRGEEVIGLIYNGDLYYYRKNLQGDIIEIVDEDGNVAATYKYDAWGNWTVSGGDVGTYNSFRYRGYYYDTAIMLYYLKTRWYDPETGRFISPDSINYLDPQSINGLNLYAYCRYNPVMYSDPTGTFGIIASLLVAAIVGAVVGVAGTFVGDVVNYAVTGEWEWSSWETSVGNAIGGAIGGMIGLVNPYAGAVIGGTVGTFSGLVLEKATGESTISWENIVIQTAISLGINAVTGNMSKYLKLPGITAGSHSWQQVFKSGFTKTLKYGFSMSAKTLAKGAGYMLVSGFTTGFLAGNFLQVIFQ